LVYSHRNVARFWILELVEGGVNRLSQHGEFDM
jgi:hypothetical protein